MPLRLLLGLKLIAPPREFALLRAVGAAEGQSQQAIGERLRIPPSRMVAFVDKIETRSLLERRHNPLDRRTRALHLTDAGREQLLDLVQRVAMALDLPPGVHAAHSALADA